MLRPVLSCGAARLRASTPLRRAAAALSAAAVLSAAPAHAVTWTEVGDAGQTVATAQRANGSTAANLTDIFGSISSAADADLFVVNIVNFAVFSASTVNAGTAVGDTALFLLTMAGAPVYTNDDASGVSLLSTLSAGSALGPLVNGLYLLGVAVSGYEPVNTSNQLLFATGTSTSLRGPASGLQPAVLGGFTNVNVFPDSGAYRIQLTGVAPVPEASTSAMLLLGGGGLGLLAARRRRNAGTRRMA